MVYKCILDFGTAREVLYLALEWFWKSCNTSDSTKKFVLGGILSKKSCWMGFSFGIIVCRRLVLDFRQLSDVWVPYFGFYCRFC